MIDELPIGPVRLEETCEYLASGFCGAAIDGYCLGGTYAGVCFG